MASSGNVGEGGGGGTGYVLVSRAKAAMFQPLKIMNPVTYLGRLPGNDVVLPSTNVSRRHAKLIVTDLGVTVHDLDSHNGIFLNGKKVRSTPVAPGDLLYIGDVCVELQRTKDVGGSFDAGSHTAVVHNDISDEDDPRARSLATLLRVSDLCGTGDDESWAVETIQLARELVEANVAVLIEVHSDGELETAVVLQPDSGKRNVVPVIWPVVQKAIDTQQPQFTIDLAESNLVDVVKDGDPKAVMAVPVLVQDAGVGAVIFLSRPQAGPVFSEAELETMNAIGRLLGLRMERARRPAEVTKIGDDTALLSAQAKLSAAEEQLQAEQQEVQVLTERVHTLEGENLKLKQQGDLERQGAQKQTAEREREAIAKLEATLAEQKKQAQKDVAQLTKEADKLKADLEKQKESARALDEDRRNRATDAEKQKQRAKDAEDALEDAKDAAAAAAARVADLEAEVKGAREAEAALAASLAAKAAAEADRKEHEAQSQNALRTALRQSVLPTLVDHVEAVAAGEATTTPAHSRQLTVLYIALAEFDAYCDRAAGRAGGPDDVKVRLDRFCAAVAARAPANGGRIDQVVGHGHLVVFAADAQSVRAAVRCALEVSSIVDAESDPAGSAGGEPAVVAGVHSGTAVAGFFGGEDGVSYVEAGLPVVVARGAIEQAPPGKDGTPKGIIVSEPVRAIVAGDPGFRITRLGQTWIKGAGAPVHLALVELEEESAS